MILHVTSSYPHTQGCWDALKCWVCNDSSQRPLDTNICLLLPRDNRRIHKRHREKYLHERSKNEVLENKIGFYLLFQNIIPFLTLPVEVPRTHLNGMRIFAIHLYSYDICGSFSFVFLCALRPLEANINDNVNVTIR